MNQYQLECFARTANTGSSSRAAKELFTTQSTVAYQITQLEKELGLTLFERDARGMHLTDAGATLLPHVTRALVALADVGEIAQALRDADARDLTVVHFQYIHDPLYTQALAALCERYPQLKVHTEVGTIRDNSEGLAGDITIIAKKARPDLYPAGTTRDVLFRTWTYAIMGADHPLAGRASVSMEDLAPYGLLFLPRETMDSLDAWYWRRAIQVPGEFKLVYADERTLHSIQLRTLTGKKGEVFISQGIHTDLAPGLVMVPIEGGEPLDVVICWHADVPGVDMAARYLIAYYRTFSDAFPATLEEAQAHAAGLLR